MLLLIYSIKWLWCAQKKYAKSGNICVCFLQVLRVSSVSNSNYQKPLKSVIGFHLRCIYHKAPFHSWRTICLSICILLPLGKAIFTYSAISFHALQLEMQFGPSPQNMFKMHRQRKRSVIVQVCLRPVVFLRVFVCSLFHLIQFL